VTGEKVLCGPHAALPENRKRPFYIIAHDTNTLTKVRAALDLGANAIEIDVHRAGGTNGFDAFHGGSAGKDVEDVLSGVKPDGDPRTPLAPLLKSIRGLGEQGRLALVYFDFKDANGDLDAVPKLFALAREHLPNDIKIVVAMDKIDKATWLTRAGSTGLRPNEAVLVDEDNNVSGVSRIFQSAHIANFGYANGITAILPGGETKETVTAAIRNHRGRAGDVKFVFVWTLAKFSSMREFLALGVDGIIVENKNIADLRHAIDYFSWGTRLATRADRVF
jgi:hypothetical protein